MVKEYVLPLDRQAELEVLRQHRVKVLTRSDVVTMEQASRNVRAAYAELMAIDDTITSVGKIDDWLEIFCTTQYGAEQSSQHWDMHVSFVPTDCKASTKLCFEIPDDYSDDTAQKFRDAALIVLTAIDGMRRFGAKKTLLINCKMAQSRTGAMLFTILMHLNRDPVLFTQSCGRLFYPNAKMLRAVYPNGGNSSDVSGAVNCETNTSGGVSNKSTSSTSASSRSTNSTNSGSAITNTTTSTNTSGRGNLAPRNKRGRSEVSNILVTCSTACQYLDLAIENIPTAKEIVADHPDMIPVLNKAYEPLVEKCRRIGQ